MIILETKEDIMLVFNNWHETKLMQLEDMMEVSQSKDEHNALQRAFELIEQLPVSVEHYINEDVMCVTEED